MRDDFQSADWAEHHTTLTDGIYAFFSTLLRVLLFWRREG
jgi:hypothetical protein